MKNKKLFMTALATGVLVFAGCGPQGCSHVDADDDHFCDKCGVQVSTHDFGGMIGYTWVNDKCTASWDCTHAGCNEKQTEEVTGTFVENTPATCTANQTGHYHAEFSLPDFGTDDSTVFDVPNTALDHSYGVPQYNWVEDECTASRACTRQGCTQVESEEGFVETVIDTPATCTTNALGHYKATFQNSAFTTQETATNSVELEGTAGHIPATAWTTDENQHWHACLRDDCEEKLNAEDHYDLDFDFYCDVCERELPGVEKVTISGLTTYIGTGESSLLAAEVTAYGGVSEEVTWELKKSDGNYWKNNPTVEVTDKFELNDNEDGTATLKAKDNTSTTELSCWVVATSKYDSTVKSSNFKMFVSTYGTDKRNALNSYFGSGNWQTIPYMGGMTFTVDGDNMTGKSTTRTIAQMVASFDNLGTWKKIKDTAALTTYILDDPENQGMAFICDVKANPSSMGKGMIDVTRVYKEWPAADLAGYVFDWYGIEETVPAFEGGFGYLIYDDVYDSGMYVYTDNPSQAESSYKQQLVEDGWFVFDKMGGDNVYGKEGQQLLLCPYAYDGKLFIGIYANGEPVTK